MPHIHKFYDFVVSCFVVYKAKVLLIHHKRYTEWLPLGGHIELNEDPEEALAREIAEESGLRVSIIGKRPDIAHSGVKPMITPPFVDVHKITDTHRHIAFVYFATTQSADVILHEKEHYAFKWFSKKDLYDRRYALSKSIRFYCLKALSSAKTFGSKSRFLTKI